MKTFVERIDELLHKQKKARKELYAACKIATNSLSNWSRANTTPSAEIAVRIAQYLGTSVEYLVNGDADALSDGDDYFIPLMRQKVSAGSGELEVQEDGGIRYWLRTSARLRRYGRNLAAFEVKGDSMAPTFRNGDVVVCDSNGYDGDGVYAICMDGDYFIKRVTRKERTVLISSDNKEYQSWEVPKESETVRVFGRVHCALKDYD